MTTRQNVAELYIATFNKTGGKDGLDYWTDKIENQGWAIETVANTFFATTEGQSTFPASLSTSDYVKTVYLNTLGVTIDEANAVQKEGLDFWVAQIDTSAMPREELILRMIQAATSETANAEDKAYLANKVAVAEAFADAGLNNDNPATSSVLEGVTSDPATLEAALAAVVAAAEAAEEFSLTTGLANVSAAEDALEAFLVTADGDDDEDTSATETEVNNAADLEEAETGALIDAGGYAVASPAVQAALISDQETINAKALTDANTRLTDANEAVAKVSGLAGAVATLIAATEATDAADVAVDEEEIALTASKSLYDLEDTAVIAGETLVDGLYTAVTDDDAVTLLELDVDDVLVIAEGIKEADYPGVTALLAAYTAMNSATTAAAKALTAQNAAQAVVDDLDLSETAGDAFVALGGGFTVTTPADDAAPTDAEVTAETDALEALETDAETTAGQTDAGALRTTATNADTAADNAEQDDQDVIDAQVIADQTDAVALRATATEADTTATNAEADDTAAATAITDAATALTLITTVTNAVAQLKTDISALSYVASDATYFTALESLLDTAEGAGTISTLDNAAILLAATNADTNDAGDTDTDLSADEVAVEAAANNAVDTENEIADVTTLSDTAALLVITTGAIADQTDAGTLRTTATNADTDADNAEQDDQDVIDAQVIADGTDAVALRTTATNADQAATDAETDDTAAADASTAVNDFEGLVTAYENAASGSNPLAEEVVLADTAIKAAQEAIDELSETVADEVEAKALQAEMDALDTAIEDAEAVITDEGYETPVTLIGDVTATSGDDVYLVGTADSVITNFGLLGSDSLFIGTDFTLNADEVAGDNGDSAVLEVWLTEAGADTEVTFETSVFGSEATITETQTITLTGVALEDVTLADGIITVA